MECLICGTTINRALMTVPSHFLDKSELYKIWQCCNCGHRQATGRVDPEFMGKIYGTSFFSSSQQDSFSSGSSINLNAAERAKFVAKIKEGKLLDVGCGNGAFLKAARHFFDVEGVEFSDEAAQQVRQAEINVYSGDFTKLDLPTEKFDVVTMWDVLASIKYPQSAMERAHAILKAHGIVFMTIPMSDSFMARLFGQYWPMLIPPVNLHYFSDQSVKALCERYGFEVLSISYEGKFVAFNFILQKMCRSLRLPKFCEPLVSKLPKWAVKVNTRDIATVILRRI